MSNNQEKTAGVAAPAVSTQNKQSNVTTASSDLIAIGLADFLKTQFKKREDILSPIIQEQSINMLYAWRGVGKTFVAIHMACAMASGSSFHDWKASKPVRVLYVDGEMPASEMQARFNDVLATGAYLGAENNITIITPDMNFPKGMPNIATRDGQASLEGFLSDVDVVIVDNISTLAYGGKENEAESWLPLQEWALRVRAMGKAVIFIHHSNKSGTQRGTSKKEDIMDTVIRLSRPDDYDPADGARFDVTYEKCRNVSGDDAKGFEAHMTPTGWVFKSFEDSKLADVHELHKERMSIRQIAKELGIPKSTVARMLKQAPP